MHLSVLKLDHVAFNLATIERANLEPILGVRTLGLGNIHFAESDAIFCRTISSIFPNVKELIIYDCHPWVRMLHFAINSQVLTDIYRFSILSKWTHSPVSYS